MKDRSGHGALVLPVITSDAAPEGQTELDRRTFLIQSALAAVGITLCACVPSGVVAPDNVSMTLKISDYPELAQVGGVALVSAQGNPIAVVRTDTTSFVALSRICPHRGTVISVESDGFYCTGHGAMFDQKGKWTGGQPTSNMQSYPTTYTASTDTLKIG